MSRRRHPKIATFPGEVRAEVDNLLEAGVTYREIAARLKAKGCDVSHASVGRYGADFLARLERMKAATAKVEAILEVSGTPLSREEAASQYTAQLLLDAIMDVDTLSDQEPLELIDRLARLQNSSTNRERLRIQWRKEQAEAAAKVAAEVREVAKKGGLSAESIAIIEESILGLGK